MARLRTFLAVELPDAVRARCVDLQEALAPARGEVKWVEEENLHITLLFLGDVDDRDLVGVCRAATKACAALAPFPTAVEGVGAFPNARRPRTIWAGITDGAEELVELHDALEGPLLALGCYRREERRYTPHVTLGRVKGDASGGGLTAALQAQADWHGGEGEVTAVRVMSSQLTPQGPIYSVMSTARLGG